MTNKKQQLSKIPFKDKKRVSIFLTEEKERELKKKAIDAGVSFSNFLSNAGTISSVEEVKKVQHKKIMDKMFGNPIKQLECIIAKTFKRPLTNQRLESLSKGVVEVSVEEIK